MFTLYLINYQSAPKLWRIDLLFTLDPKDLTRFLRRLWSGKLRFQKRYVPYGIAFWNACSHLIQMIRHDFWYDYDREGSDSDKGTFRMGQLFGMLSSHMNSLFSGLARFWNRIALSFSRTWGKVPIAKRKEIWSIPDPVQCEQFRSGLIRIDQVWFDFPDQCAHCIGPISKLAKKSFHVNMAWIVQYVVVWSYDYTVRCIARILLYWCHVQYPHARSSFLDKLIRDTGQGPLNRTSFKSIAEWGITRYISCKK